MRPTTLAWVAPWPKAMVLDPARRRHHALQPATAAEKWPNLPRLWAEARKLDAIYNQRSAR